MLRDAPNPVEIASLNISLPTELETDSARRCAIKHTLHNQVSPVLRPG